MKLNGHEVGPDYGTLSNTALSMLLGQDGMPKYTASQLKGKTKAGLVAEVRAAIELIGEPKTKGPSVSKTKEVAQSKLCRFLKDIAAGKKTIEQFKALIAVDYVLADYVADKWANVEAAAEGRRPRGN
jgi:hypothetical protein